MRKKRKSRGEVFEDDFDLEDIEIEDLDEKPAAKKKIRTTEYFIITYLFVFLMLALMGNLVYYIMKDSETVINNSYNTRQEILATKNIRGKILSRDGDILAQTGRNEQGVEIRYYPYKDIFCHVVGYATKGKSGIELSENINLLTSNDPILVRIQNEVDSVKNYGDNVVTTLDVGLQKACYEALGAYDGAIIVSDPKTGEILAMVSKPGYDPNEINAIWDKLINDKESSVLLNRATQGLYPPGSTFKIVTALEYYRENGQDVSGYHYQCNGSFRYNGDRINCYHGSSHGSEDLKKSFEKSCNASFANIGVGLDVAKLQDTCKELLFNSDLPYELPFNKSSFVLGVDDDSYDVMQTSIGQGKTQITPLHMNLITNAIANGGEVKYPYLVSRIENYSGKLIKNCEVNRSRRLMTQAEADFLTDLMKGVVENGTGTKLKGLSYTAAGKTGSAEYNGEKSDSHAWFTGFAPVEDPKISVTVIVEGAGSGGDYAVPMAKRIFDEFFSQ
ncbi:MAG: penicillin-binding protein 2 [Lachnospiraceae bacterium]|jgi:peptidoglycan glycosyltransferase|nr:penicillin-binding protein 2 [Lachnospiraceae bacterium]